MDQINSLFGWSKVVPVEKISNFKSLFQDISSVKELLVAIDCSGSVSYTGKLSYDKKPFSEIYIEAIQTLFKNALNNVLHNLIFWASDAKILNNKEINAFNTCLENSLPFSEIVHTIGSGTSPVNILKYLDNKASVIVTDGSIESYQVLDIKNKINNYSSGPIFLIIVPHIDEHPNLYKENVELNALDNINITIPQAFSTKLASVLVYNYHKKSYYMVPELTAPWINKDLNINEILKNKMPLVSQTNLISKIDDQYKTFDLKELKNYVENNQKSSSEIIQDLIDYKISETIKQQGTIEHKNLFNNICTILYNRCLADKLANYKNLEIDNNLPLLEKLQLSAKHEQGKNEIIKEFTKQYGDIFNKLSIDKTIGEITSVGAAKRLQTQYNVKNFQSMKQEDKMSELMSILPKDECTICGDTNNTLSAINLSAKLLLGMKTKCTETVQSRGKKNKMVTNTFLKKDEFRKLLEMEQPRIHYAKFCHTCAINTMKQAKEHGDPECGITKLFPQNIINGLVVNRLLVLPLIDINNISENSNPNEPKLSYVRQTWRGLFSNIMGLPVAGDDVLIAILMFLTCLASEDNAKQIYDNQLSFLRGGQNDKYPTSIGRLFKLSLTPLTSQTMFYITTIYPVIELARMQIIPETRKILLFCLLEKKIWPLINAKQLKDKAITKFNQLYNNIKNNKVDHDEIKFNLNENIKTQIITSSDFDTFIQNSDILNNNIGYYLQNRGLNIERLVNDETKIKNLLQSENFDQVAFNLYIEAEYLKNTMNSINMNFDTFKEILPKFIHELTLTKNSSDIILKYLV
ncbi:hypothetical protein Hokovirus_4_57 [Hokovirus HKV1]|uniref:Uncharacterized protein n=1 Tax=Hokovirus HKV1 TaxID=1977638 RepID=A0A1V0SH96_9VIRU|nr:hypothetical protein Hokovirus_4_57 [Hokovirus HKV1]